MRFLDQIKPFSGLLPLFTVEKRKPYFSRAFH